jgi:hypothetical protein
MITWDPEGDNHNSTPVSIRENSESPHEKHQSGQTAIRSMPSIPIFYVMRFHNRWTLQCSNAVGTAASHGLDDRGVWVRVLVETKFLSPLRRPYRFWDPPTLLTNGKKNLFPWGSMRPGCEADNLPLTTAEVNNTLIYTYRDHFAYYHYGICWTQGFE